jgi:hypothetical protein
MVFKEEDEEKLELGIEIILTQWVLLVGAMDVKWEEFSQKRLRLLPQLMDCSPYDFSKLPYTECHKILIKELTNYILGKQLLPHS